jgi:hypothetical protein
VELVAAERAEAEWVAETEAEAKAADLGEAGLEDGEATAAVRVRKYAVPTMRNMSIPKR